MVVVLIGLGEFTELELLADAVGKRGEEVVVCDLHDWPGDTPVTFDPAGDAAVFGTPIQFDEVTGAYVASHQLFRPYDPRFSESLQAEVVPALNQLREYRGLFESFCRTLERDAEVVPALRNHYWQHHKPWQLSLFERLDVPVPDTLFTNEPEAVETFVADHDRVVYKPVTRGAIPRELTETDLTERLDALATAPVQFQEYIEGEDLRVYVLDGEVVAAVRYESDDLSFQHTVQEGDPDELTVRPTDLSADLTADLLDAADASGLTFAGADVRRRSDGSYAVLELNEAPRFAAPDVRGDQNAAGALADHLV